MLSVNWISGLIEEENPDYFIQGERSRIFSFGKLIRFDMEYIFLNICYAGEKLERNKL